MATPATLSQVPALTPYIQYTASSLQAVFPYPFPITQDSDLVVVLNGVTQPTDSGYTVSGVGNPTGGNITFTTGLAGGTTVTLFRNITIQRITQIGQNSGFASTVFNAEFNNIYLILQQLAESIGFSLQLPNTNSPAPTVLLTPSNYANKFLAFDANGNPTPALMSSTVMTQAIIGGLLFAQTPAEASAGAAPTNMVYPPGNGLRFGMVGDGATLNDSPFATAMSVGTPLYVPGGTYLMKASQVFNNGQTLFGDGMGKTIFHVKATSTFPAIYGFYVNNVSNILLKDISIIADCDNRSWCAALQPSGTVDNLSFERVGLIGGLTISGITQASSAVVTSSAAGASNPFTVGYLTNFYGVNGMTQINGKVGTITAVGGSTGAWTATVNINTSAMSPYTTGGVIVNKLNNWGVNINTCTLTGFFMHRCRFEGTDLGVVKGSSDTSTQARCVFSDCYATNCTDVFEFNSPGGLWTDIDVSGFVCDSIVQFPVGLAHAQRVSIRGMKATNCRQEVIHIEDGSSEVEIVGLATQNVTTTSSNVGAINIMSGGVGGRQTTGVSISACNFDLTQNTTGMTYAITVQAGGTTPDDIDISGNTFRCAGFSAWNSSTAYVVGNIVSSGGVYYFCILANTNNAPPNATYWSVVNPTAVLLSSLGSGETSINNNIFDNPNSASQIPAFLDLSNSYVTGAGNVFNNPAVLAHIANDSYGTLTDSKITGSLANFAFLSGNTNGSTGICFDGFSIHRAFTCDNVPTPQNVFPAGTIFDVTVGMRFQQNGTNGTFVETVKLDWDGTTLTVGTPKKNAGTGTVTPPTAGQWTQSGGQIRAAASNASTITGVAQLNVKGPYFP